ncbi:MAG: hypothetical protein HY078_01515 [Elusimicrobia bacterium]|nr:hypothetical protein [Elusimicrobiota bacterium]
MNVHRRRLLIAVTALVFASTGRRAAGSEWAAFDAPGSARSAPESEILGMLMSTAHEADVPEVPLIPVADRRAPRPSVAPAQRTRQWTRSEAVNKRLDGCLQKLSCRISTRGGGVSRSMDPKERCMASRSPWSCHLLNEAIDITSASCGLETLRACLDGAGYRTCYGHKGGCRDHGIDVLHFGNHEIFCGPRIFFRAGSC